MKMRAVLSLAGAAGILATSLAAAPEPAEAMNPWRFLDPTRVIEVPPTPESAQGTIESVSFTDDHDGDHTVQNRGHLQHYGRVKAEASGYTPGETYTVRVTAREAGTGDDWGVYTWQSYVADENGRIHVDLRLLIPFNREESPGDQVVAAPVIYRAEDVRQDGRPEKQEPGCVLNCDRVPPLAAWDDYTDPASTITLG